MLAFETYLTFTAAVVLLSLAPGPDNIFVLTQSALNGARAGVFVVLGLCTGLVVHSTAVAFGVAALVQTSALAFSILKFAGAGYLLYLAWQAWRTPSVAMEGAPITVSPFALYRRGLIMNISNPKVAIFFLAFFPQFTDPTRGSVIPQIVSLGLIFMAVTFSVFGVVALVAGGLRSVLARSPRIQRMINRIAAFVFVGLAAKIATSSR